MYELISSIIDHSWVSTNAGEQQYIYYISGAIIVILTVAFTDLIYRTFRSFWGR